MATGYILISVKHNKEQKLYDHLDTFDEVVDMNILFGEWDIIVKISMDETEKIGAFVMDNIRSQEEVEMTSTLIVAK